MANSLPVDAYVEWAPNNTVYTSDRACTWTRLSSVVGRADHGIRDLVWNRGSDRSFQRIEAGKMTVTLGDSDGSLNPLNTGGPNAGLLTSNRRIRFRVQTATSTYTLWSGTTTGFYPDWNLQDAWCVIECIDNLKHCAVPVIDSALFGVIQGLNPAWWFPMSEGGGASANLGSLGNNYRLANVNTSPRSGGPIGGWGSEVPQQYGGGSFSIVQTVSPLTNWSGVPTATFTIMALCIPGSYSSGAVSQVITGLGPTSAGQPSGDITLQTVTTAGVVQFAVWNGVTQNLVQSANNSFASGQPIMVIARYSSVNGATYLLLNNTLSALNGTAGINPRTGGYAWIGNGADLTKPLYGALSHWCTWNSWVADADCTALYNAWNAPYNGETADVRIKRLLTQCGAGTSNYSAKSDVGISALGPASYRSTGSQQPLQGRAAGAASGGLAIDLIRRAANTDPGRFFCNRDGEYEFQAFNHMPKANPLTWWYDTDPARGGDRVGFDLQENQSTFESGVDLSFWAPANGTITNSSPPNAPNGKKAMRITATAGVFYPQHSGSTILCRAGDIVSLSASVSAQFALFGTSYCYSQISFYDAASNILSSVTGGLNGVSVFLGAPIGTYTWGRMSVTGTAPANAAYVLAWPALSTNASIGDIMDYDLFKVNITRAQGAITSVRIGYNLQESQSRFETGYDPNFWATFGLSGLTNGGSGYTGSKSASGTATGAALYWGRSNIPVTPGQVVSVSSAAWLNSATASIYPQLSFYDQNGINLGDFVGTSKVSNSTFQVLTMSMTVPPNAKTVSYFPYVTTGAAVGQFAALDEIHCDIWQTPPGQRIPLLDVEFANDDRTFYNEATVQVAAPQPLALTFDAASVPTLGIVAWNDPTECITAVTAPQLAASVYGQGLPRTQIQKAVTLYDDSQPDEVLTTDVGDIISVVARNPTAPPFVQPGSTVLGVKGHLDGRRLMLQITRNVTPGAGVAGS